MKLFVHKLLGKYPCNDYLNNALRFLLSENPNIDKAISEIKYAIQKSGGVIFDDVLVKLNERVNKGE